VADQILNVKTLVHKIKKLDLDADPIVRAIAKRVAELVKKQINQGREAGGRKLKEPKTQNKFGAGKPMVDTGQLRDSIKAKRAAKRRRQEDTHYVVEPTGNRDTTISVKRASGKTYTRALSNFAVHAINARRRNVNVMRGASTLEEAIEAGQKPIDKQVRKKSKTMLKFDRKGRVVR